MISPLYGQLSPLRVPTIFPDPDALAYIAAVETADGQALEDGVKSAYDQFFKGLKQDGIWSAIQASCILAGARTLSGALIPLAGTAPTNNNFVTADYNRKTGLIGNGSTKRISTINNNLLGQNNHHIFLRITDTDQRGSCGIMGTNTNTNGGSSMRQDNATSFPFASMSFGTSSFSTSNSFFAGGCGSTRNNSANFTGMINGNTALATRASQTPVSQIIQVFSTGTSRYTTSRVSFYSLGSSLSLTVLNNRVSTLMTALAAAIP
jgi:hypothetical protein